MSFIFSPSPYEDKRAINYPEVEASVLNECLFKYDNVTSGFFDLLKSLKSGVVSLDGAPSAEFNRMVKSIRSKAKIENFNIKYIPIDKIYKSSDELYDFLLTYLPEDKIKDPSQIFGRVFKEKYDSIFDNSKLIKLLADLEKYKKEGEIVLLYGQGAGSESFWNIADKVIFFDVTPKTMFSRIKNSEYTCLGDEKGLAIRQEFRRIYYIDFQLSLHLREELIKTNRLDYYITSERDEESIMISHSAMRKVLLNLAKRPFRCKPIYSEGVWGGYFLMKARNLPKDQFRNIAWAVDMIPMDNSLVIQMNDQKDIFELPFMAFLQEVPEQIMGKTLTERFGRYFPIRFSYDDTFHSPGNMSIQCHPRKEFCKNNFGEYYGQDEAYYVIETGVGAKTYCGFKNGVNVDDFMVEAKKSETNKTKFDHDKYVNSIQSIPGRQFLIPGGTIHASGRNQLVLEIGSLIMGSYTFKQYDYMRKDLDGNPRPIHTYYGEKVLEKDRNEDFVNKRLVKDPVLLKKGDTWEEYLLGEDPLVYFSTRQIRFSDKAEGNTNGRFHVLTLADGEKVRIQSKKDPNKCYHLNFLDIVVVPSDIGEYEIINEDVRKQPIVVYKVQVKE